MSGIVKSVNISTVKGQMKVPVTQAVLKENHGIEGDAHAGPGIKQVSLLSWESVERQIEQMRSCGVGCPKKAQLASEGGSNAGDAYEIGPGDYAENLTVEAIDLGSVRIGQRFEVGDAIVLEVTAIGKECHHRCAVYKRLGDCVMPREGVFTRVVTGGDLRPGAPIRMID